MSRVRSQSQRATYTSKGTNMDPNTQSPSDDGMYEDFEPASQWTRDQTSVTLIVRLPGFSRQEFKILYTSVLSISGERKISDTKWLRFNKEFSIPSDCDTKNMAAKFQNGVLHVTFPTKPQEITKMAPPEEEEEEEEASRPITMEKTRSGGVSKETTQKEKEPTKSQLPKEDSQSDQKEMTQYYEDFEPSFEWSREEKSATLLVKLPGFSKEHLKNIEFTSVLTISGERKITETKWLRFNKQFSIPSDCDTDKMSATLQNGVLSVMFPLVITPTKPQEITKKPLAEEAPSEAKTKEDSVRTTERKEKEVTKPSPEGASQRPQAKAEPEEKTMAPEAPRLQVLMPEAPIKSVDKQKAGEEVPPKPREDKADVKISEVSEKTPQKKETKTIPKEVSQETMKPSEAPELQHPVPEVQTQRIDQEKAAEEVPAKLREEKAEVKTNEVSEKIPEKEKETTKTPEEGPQSGGQKFMKPQETTKQPEAASSMPQRLPVPEVPTTQRVDQQKIAQEVVSKPKKDKSEAKSSEILKDTPQNEKEPSSTKEEEKRVAEAKKIAEKKVRTNGLIETEKGTGSEVHEKQGAKMITKAKTRILDFTLSLRSTDKDDKEVLGGLKKPELKKLIVVILLVVVLGLYAKNAFRSKSNLGGSEFKEL